MNFRCEDLIYSCSKGFKEFDGKSCCEKTVELSTTLGKCYMLYNHNETIQRINGQTGGYAIFVHNKHDDIGKYGYNN